MLYTFNTYMYTYVIIYIYICNSSPRPYICIIASFNTTWLTGYSYWAAHGSGKNNKKNNIDNLIDCNINSNKNNNSNDNRIKTLIKETLDQGVKYVQS